MVLRTSYGLHFVRNIAVAFTLTVVASGAGHAQDAVSPSASALRDRLEAASSETQDIAEQAALKQFYEARAFTPIWFDEAGPTRAATLLIKELEQAAAWGLRAEDFALSDAVKAGGARPASGVAAADFELSAALLKYARHAAGGRISEPERRLSDYIDRRPPLPVAAEVIAALAGAANPAEVLRGYHPQHPQFQKLHELYVSLAGEAAGAQPQIKAQGPMLVPGSKGPEIAALRQRLGLGPGTSETDLYDDDLLDAVKSFQKANKLKADGYIGPRTRVALQRRGNGEKLQAIAATMEQWRWMPRDLGKRHALVNIPAYSIDFIEGGKTALSERVIVGRPQTPTPVFTKSMSSIVLKPSWSLPDSIKLEKLQRASRRGGSLEDEGLIVKKGSKTVQSWSVDWSRANLSHYTIYQPSGDSNALGKVKFLFPNKFSVYLHDTPNKSLFEAADRTFSHGCIRLRNPIKVAQFVLDWDKGDGELDAKWLASKGPSNNEITLDSPLPVHVGYFTVWVNDDGEAQYLDDPYGHVERVHLALAGKWDDIDRGPRHNVGTTAVAGVKLDDETAARPRARPAATGQPAAFAPAMGLFSAPIPKFSKSNPVASASSIKSSGGKHKSGGFVGDLMNNALR